MLLDTAARLAMDHGPDGVTMDAVAASAGVSRPLVYKHFANREELLGAEGMLYGSYEMVRPDVALFSDSLQKGFLRSRANSIEGGTTEVMKNILGERVLGLPGDIRVDKDRAWLEVPRS